MAEDFLGSDFDEEVEPGRQIDGSLVIGPTLGCRYELPVCGYRNDSGIPLDSGKILAMPARNKCFISDYSERFRDDDTQATMQWDIPWSVRNAWREWCLGYSAIDDFGRLSRIPPVQHPELTWLYAVECELVSGLGVLLTRSDIPIQDPSTGESVLAIDGKSDFWPMPAYGEPNREDDTYSDGIARYRVTYRDLHYDVLSDTQLDAVLAGLKGSPDVRELYRNVTRSYNYAIRGTDLPAAAKSALTFADTPINRTGGVAGKPIVSQGITIIRPIIQAEYTWHDVPQVPWDAHTACLGRVNSRGIDLSGKFHPMFPESALCQAPKIVPYRDKTGRRSYTITYRFDIDPINTWNKFPAADGQFYLATFDGTEDGPRVYPKADFSQLFDVE